MTFSLKQAQRFTEGPTRAAGRPPAMPYPDGWFAVAHSAELTPGTVLTRPLQGEDVVLYRLRDGAVRAVRPYCPHLGTHLGLSDVEGDDLVCPFHRFAFGPDGTCVRTPYGAPPSSAALTRLPVHEADDAVYVWRHHDDAPPQWELPALHTLGHVPPRTTTWEISGHAQDALENAVDLGHFSALHGWRDFELTEPVSFEDRGFRVSLRVRERFPLLGDTALEVTLEGSGISRLHVCTAIPRIGLRTCSMILPTMIAPNRFQLRQSCRIAFSAPRALPAPLARLLTRTAPRLLSGTALRASRTFVSEDFPIWDTKQYQSPPRLAQGDGPIGPFRHWSRQFYPPTQIASPEADRKVVLSSTALSGASGGC
ncbi:Rieske 2Fe-2S domain-containing protein [Streptomyces sp. CBMA29]|uniref:Rieske 2Fe-2S domain-containing protein n=1 Tax=Streptomyces sp. CBMA29 TaxID=1896314 RepID=UPI0016619E7E|nr:Rieske 2Fe-2S domain-containing protein [Streptomyces sp. CBMA29]MBD0734543.1 (2Fe-2S)-binding protein [Streptomyces sp. CBMA29]